MNNMSKLDDNFIFISNYIVSIHKLNQGSLLMIFFINYDLGIAYDLLYKEIRLLT